MAKNLDHPVSELIETISLLIRRLRSEPGGEELSLTETAVLRRLQDDGAMSTADLARAEHMKPQSMGSTVAALEERGLIKRKADPEDGRRMHLQLTAKGMALRESRRAAKYSRITAQIEKLSKDEQETLFRAGKILRRMVER